MIDGYQVYLGGSAVADFMIAASMLYFARTFSSLKVLYSYLNPCPQWISTKRRIAFSNDTDKRISRLIRSTFLTGALCSVAFIDVAIYVHFGHNFFHIAMCVLLYFARLRTGFVLADLALLAA